MKRIVFLLCLTIIAITALSQNAYRLQVKQVFPNQATVYDNSFDFERRMNDALRSVTSKYTGNKCNYVIVTTSPKGKQTRQIQNVSWVQTVNGSTTYHARQTSPASTYNVATIWKGYACNINGAARGGATVREFIYRVALQENAADVFKTAFVEQRTAKAEADRLYKKALASNQSTDVIVYKYTGTTATEFSRVSSSGVLKARADSVAEMQAKQAVLDSLVVQFKSQLLQNVALKDSIGVIAVLDSCSSLLKSVNQEIPDSVFGTYNLASYYRTIIVDSILPQDKQELLLMIPFTAVTCDSLNSCTRSIREALYVPPFMQELGDDARLMKEYTFEGHQFKYYERPKKDGVRRKKDYMLVDTTSGEYWIGKFKPLETSEGKLIMMEPDKKTIHYDSNGEEVKPETDKTE